MVDDTQLWTAYIKNTALKTNNQSSQIYSHTFQVNFSLVRYLIL